MFILDLNLVGRLHHGQCNIHWVSNVCPVFMKSSAQNKYKYVNCTLKYDTSVGDLNSWGW